MRTITLILIAAAFSFSSCSKNDNGDDNPANGGSMTLKYDGNSWSADLAVQAVNTNGVLTVSGSDNSAHQCNITLLNIPGTGTYDLGVTMSNPNTGRWTEGLDQNDTYTTSLGQGSGSCTITELTASKVAGTFNFTAKNMAGAVVSVTEGSFSADL